MKPLPTPRVSQTPRDLGARGPEDSFRRRPGRVDTRALVRKADWTYLGKTLPVDHRQSDSGSPGDVSCRDSVQSPGTSPVATLCSPRGPEVSDVSVYLWVAARSSASSFVSRPLAAPQPWDGRRTRVVGRTRHRVPVAARRSTGRPRAVGSPPPSGAGALLSQTLPR